MNQIFQSSSVILRWYVDACSQETQTSYDENYLFRRNYISNNKCFEIICLIFNIELSWKENCELICFRSNDDNVWYPGRRDSFHDFYGLKIGCWVVYGDWSFQKGPWKTGESIFYKDRRFTPHSYNSSDYVFWWISVSELMKQN